MGARVGTVFFAGLAPPMFGFGSEEGEIQEKSERAGSGFAPKQP